MFLFIVSVVVRRTGHHQPDRPGGQFCQYLRTVARMYLVQPLLHQGRPYMPGGPPQQFVKSHRDMDFVSHWLPLRATA